jgi:acetyltransferase
MKYQGGHIVQPFRFRTRRGQLVAVRQATAADTVQLAGLLSQLSLRTLQLRYMRMGNFSAETLWHEAIRMARGYTSAYLTLMASIPLNGDGETVAIAELVQNQQDPTLGEIAFVVRDDIQKQGIGSLLFWRLICEAQRSGITRLSACMLAENSAMLRLIRTLGLPYTATTRYGEMQVFISLPGYHTESIFAPGTYKLAV